jgi:hypothetical protein
MQIKTSEAIIMIILCAKLKADKNIKIKNEK